MDKREFDRRKDLIIAMTATHPTDAYIHSTRQIQATLLLAEVVNEGVIALQGICNALADLDAKEVIRRDKKDNSDVMPVDDDDSHLTLDDDPEATLDERDYPLPRTA